MPDAHGRPIHYAFIDSQNLNLGVRGQGWRIDSHRFRTYLEEKYDVAKAFLFIGYVPAQKRLYAFLEKAGFICIFKPAVTQRDGLMKGNVDAELVLHTMIEYPEYDKAIIVTGDGDFYCLVKYLLEKNKLRAILIPNKERYSALLKYKIFRPYLRFMNDLQARVGLKEKASQGRNLVR